jgi:hypothetical protein
MRWRRLKLHTVTTALLPDDGGATVSESELPLVTLITNDLSVTHLVILPAPQIEPYMLSRQHQESFVSVPPSNLVSSDSH